MVAPTNTVTFVGTLQEVNIAHRTCQIYVLPDKQVNCTFTPAQAAVVKRLLGEMVSVTGRTITASDPSSEVSIAGIESVEAEARVMTAKDLLESGLVGLWADREDIGDSVEFARQLRERAWKRGGQE